MPRIGLALSLLVGVAAALVAPAAQAAPPPTLAVHVINQSGVPDDEVYLTLQNTAGTANSIDDTVRNDVPIKLSDITDGTFRLESNNGTTGGIPGARLYVGFHGSADNGTTVASSTRFDKIELDTQPAGVADLTSLDFFGIPFKLRTLDASGTQLGAANEPYGTTMIAALRAIPGSSSAEVRNGGAFVRYVGPGLAPASYPSYDGYIASLVSSTLRVRSFFSGNPSISAPASVLDYEGALQPDGSLTLTGTVYSAADPTGVAGDPVSIAAGDLTSAAVYGASGTYSVNGVPHTANDQYGALYRDLLAGFDLGLWGGIYGNSSNDWCATPVQATFSSDPHATYCPIYSKPAFAAARPGGEGFAAYDQYAEVIHRLSDSYGFPYSDLTDDRVQLPLDPARTLELTILPDSAPVTPTPSRSTPASTPVAVPVPPPAPAPAAPTALAPAAPKLTVEDLRDALSLRDRARVDGQGIVRIGSVRCNVRCGQLDITLGETADDVKVTEGWSGEPRAGRRDLLDLELTRAALKRLRKDGKATVRVTATLHTDAGAVLRIRERLTLLAPKRR